MNYAPKTAFGVATLCRAALGLLFWMKPTLRTFPLSLQTAQRSQGPPEALVPSSSPLKWRQQKQLDYTGSPCVSSS